MPSIKIIPDLSTGQITSSSFLVFNPGYFLSRTEDSSIGVQLEMINTAGEVSYTQDGEIWGNVKSNQLDPFNPISVRPDASIFFGGNIDYKVINIRVSSSTRNTVYGETEKIIII